MKNRMFKIMALVGVILLSGSQLFAKAHSAKKIEDPFAGQISPRIRVIIDNDFSGDPDGLFELTHFLLSKSVDVRGIIGSHLKPGDGFDPSKETATHAAANAKKVLDILGMTGKVPVFQGTNEPLKDTVTAQNSAAEEFIIKEALRTDTKEPLYVVCGAGLTDLASAWLKNPEIQNKLTLVWIGGPEYPDLALPPKGYSIPEYNLGIDIAAGQVIFNQSQIPVWQVPRNVYRQALVSFTELSERVAPCGEIGQFLTSSLAKLVQTINHYGMNIGETYILGDSPLVLLTALQSSFQPDASSSDFAIEQAPLISDRGLYLPNLSGRNIRVYTHLDCRLMFEDFYLKLKKFSDQ